MIPMIPMIPMLHRVLFECPSRSVRERFGKRASFPKRSRTMVEQHCMNTRFEVNQTRLLVKKNNAKCEFKHLAEWCFLNS